MVQNRAKVGAMFRHIARAALAETDAMSLPDTLKCDFPAVFLGREIVAWNGIPAEPPSDGEAPVFAMKPE